MSLSAKIHRSWHKYEMLWLVGLLAVGFGLGACAAHLFWHLCIKGNWHDKG